MLTNEHFLHAKTRKTDLPKKVSGSFFAKTFKKTCAM